MEKFEQFLISNARVEQEQEITYEQRNELIHFNTERYWHCYYDPKTGVLYNEYCKRLMDNAKDYLISIGLLNEKNEQLKYFEEV